MSAPMLTHEEISSCIPHAGDMVLLDHIASWDDTTIYAVATSHRNADNPLRNDKNLGIAAGIEYAAQAIAVHGYWLARQSAGKVRTGRIVSVRDISCTVQQLDNIVEDLKIQATQLLLDDAAMNYVFAIHAGSSLLMQGRVTISLTDD